MRIRDWSSDVCSSDLSAKSSAIEKAGAGGTSSPRRGQSAISAFTASSEVTTMSPSSNSFRGGGWGSSVPPTRSDERRVGERSLGTWRSRVCAYHSNNKYRIYTTNQKEHNKRIT